MGTIESKHRDADMNIIKNENLKPELNSEWIWNADGQTYKVVGSKTMESGRTGIELVRFIKTRGAWATTPKVFSYMEAWIDEDNEVVDYDVFHKAFKAA